MNASVVALRKGLFACTLSAGFALLGIPAAGAVTVDLNSPTGDLGVSHTYALGSGSVTATAGTLSGSTFTPSSGTLQLFGKSSADPSENGLGLDPGVDNEISASSVIEVSFSSGFAPNSRTFSMDSVQSPDNWSVYESSNATSGFSVIPTLQNMTDQLTDHSLPDAAFYLFAIGNSSGSSVLLSTLDATVSSVPVPPAMFLFGTALAGLGGLLRRRRKEASALQAV